MNMSQDAKIHKNLTEIKQNYAIKRLRFASKLGSILSIVNLFSEISVHGLFGNYSNKLILICIHAIHYKLPSLLSHYEKYAKTISFVVSELVSLILITYAFLIHPQSELVWTQLSVITSFFYQSFLFSDVPSLLFFSFKQTSIWLISGFYFEKISLQDPGALLTGTASTLIFYFACTYFDYLKDIEMCKSKNEVQASNEKMLSILGAIPDAICVISQNFKVLFANSAFTTQLGSENTIELFSQSQYHRRYFAGNSQNCVILQDIADSFYFELGKDINFGIIELKNELIEWKGKLIVWDHKLSMILFGKNVTNLLKLQRESSENQYKSALLRTVSHELRTPINAILSMTSIIKGTSEVSNENLERLEIISASCTYQLYLINDLLDYAQIIAGCLKISKSAFSLYSLISECLSLIQLQECNVKFELKISEVPEKIVSDPHRLKQIILNLLSNAKKFTLKGFVTLKVRCKNSWLKVECIDTGIGIAPEKLSILFTQFGKIDESAGINPQGVGLGLLISNMLVKELGGQRIKVKSALGKGSCFSFKLKIEEVSNNVMEIPEENIRIYIPSILAKSRPTKTEVLIVDDTYFNIVAYSQLLSLEGIESEHAVNGEQAIEKIKKYEFACVLMDCEMPILDGWETSKKIKNMKINKEIKKCPIIIACTAYSNEYIKNKCIEAGMDDFLLKPCGKDIFISKVKFWLEKYKNYINN